MSVQQPQQKASLLDNFVGASEQCRWHREAEHHCCRQIDDKLELGRLRDAKNNWRRFQVLSAQQCEVKRTRHESCASTGKP
jgi:DNA repair ATPase RecN